MALSDGTYVKEEEPRRPVAPSRGHDMPSNDPPSSSLLLGASLLQDDQSETKVMSKIQIRDGAEGGRIGEDNLRQMFGGLSACQTRVGVARNWPHADKLHCTLHRLRALQRQKCNHRRLN